MTHLERRTLTALLATLSLLAVACGNGDACVFDNDCPFGDRCSTEGRCVPLGDSDAGEPEDAGEEEDAGPLEEDAGPLEDAGPVDAGPEQDAGPFDAGPPVDAGPQVDAGPFDAGPPVDAGPANCPTAVGMYSVCDNGGLAQCPSPVCYVNTHRVIAEGSAPCRFTISSIGTPSAVMGTFDVAPDGSFDASGLTLSSGGTGCTGQIGSTIVLTCTTGCGQEWTNTL